MFICIDKSIGSIAVSDEPMQSKKYIECDGRVIKRADYKKLFEALKVKGETFKLPQYRNILKGAYFYMIAND